MQNGFIERFNGSYRREILDAYLFFDLCEVRQLTQQWIREYNYNRPHEGLNGATPAECNETKRGGNMENSAATQSRQSLPHYHDRNINNGIEVSTERSV
jgi:putative transposase